MHLTLKHYLLGLAVLGSLPSSTGRALPKTRRDALDRKSKGTIPHATNQH